MGDGKLARQIRQVRSPCNSVIDRELGGDYFYTAQEPVGLATREVFIHPLSATGPRERWTTAIRALLLPHRAANRLN